MPTASMQHRVKVLEDKVEALAELPGRMTRLETVVAEFRSEVRAGFATLRDEMRAGDEETRQQMHALHDRAVERIDGLDRKIEGLDRKIEGLDHKIQGLDQKIDSGDEETRRQMRVLHEEVITRLKLLQEGKGRAKRNRGK